MAANVAAPMGFITCRRYDGASPNYAMQEGFIAYNYGSRINYGDPVYRYTDGNYRLYAAAGTTYNPLIGGDGVALFSTAHPIDNGTYANKPSTELDLNEAALETALNQIRVFPDQAGLISMVRGKKLIVPVALQWAAERLTKTELRVGTNNNDVSAIYSTGALPDGYVVNEFLTSSFAWFVLTTVKGLGYYQRTEYEMDLQVDPTTGNLLVLGFERYGMAHKNPRAIWGTFPTA
jgi:uncharacterized protein YlzI (FlbEa/FlbD family)